MLFMRFFNNRIRVILFEKRKYIVFEPLKKEKHFNGDDDNYTLVGNNALYFLK